MALTPIEKVLLLKQVPLFRELNGEALQSLLPIVRECEFSSGEKIITEGDEADCLYILVEGEAEARPDAKAPGQVFGSRDVIGELAIVTRERRAATCIAVSEVRALRIDRNTFEEVLYEHPEITIGVMQMLASRVRESRGQPGA